MEELIKKTNLELISADFRYQPKPQKGINDQAHLMKSNISCCERAGAPSLKSSAALTPSNRCNLVTWLLVSCRNFIHPGFYCQDPSEFNRQHFSANRHEFWF